jgi:hypothetical protein
VDVNDKSKKTGQGQSVTNQGRTIRLGRELGGTACTIPAAFGAGHEGTSFCRDIITAAQNITQELGHCTCSLFCVLHVKLDDCVLETGYPRHLIECNRTTENG